MNLASFCLANKDSFDTPASGFMLPHVRKVTVPLAGRSYTIQIAPGLIPRLGRECEKLGLPKSCAVITDSNVEPLFALKCKRALHGAGIKAAVISVPAGEKSKSLKSASDCYDALAARRFNRQSFILALGGGVVGDLAGFVAATYLRGIPFVQVPTTLLAQVDSSVGGKTGVNLKAGKNLVGAFYQPRLVVCDLDTLKTLPSREFKSGLAEIVKYGVIYDPALFHRLEKDMPRLLKMEPGVLAPVIQRCCEIKAEVVGQDETESGLRAILNFGHTVGHALEAVSGYGKFLHGEAISVGMVAAAALSSSLLGFSESDRLRLTALLQEAGLPVRARVSTRQRQGLFEAMKLDKKARDGEITFVLASRIGCVEWNRAVQPALIDEALQCCT